MRWVLQPSHLFPELYERPAPLGSPSHAGTNGNDDDHNQQHHHQQQQGGGGRRGRRGRMRGPQGAGQQNNHNDNDNDNDNVDDNDNIDDNDDAGGSDDEGEGAERSFATELGPLPPRPGANWEREVALRHHWHWAALTGQVLVAAPNPSACMHRMFHMCCVLADTAASWATHVPHARLVDVASATPNGVGRRVLKWLREQPAANTNYHQDKHSEEQQQEEEEEEEQGEEKSGRRVSGRHEAHHCVFDSPGLAGPVLACVDPFFLQRRDVFAFFTQHGSYSASFAHTRTVLTSLMALGADVVLLAPHPGMGQRQPVTAYNGAFAPRTNGTDPSLVFPQCSYQRQRRRFGEEDWDDREERRDDDDGGGGEEGKEGCGFFAASLAHSSVLWSRPEAAEILDDIADTGTR